MTQRPLWQLDFQHDALLVIDVQPTFMPGGGLAVKDGDQVLPVVTELVSRFPFNRRFATKDRHPIGHISLASSYIGVQPMTVLTPNMIDNVELASFALFSKEDLRSYLKITGFQVLWPNHAIAGTREAELHSFFREYDFELVWTKGMDARCDSYSGFFDNLHRSTGFAGLLRQYGITRVYCVGLAEDYCVGWTAEGAVEQGFEAVVLSDATRPVGFPEDSVSRMIQSFNEKGIGYFASRELSF